MSCLTRTLAVLLGAVALYSGCQPSGRAARPESSRDARPAASSPQQLALVPKAATEGINRFGTDLYEKLRHKPGNIVISPPSIAIALAMSSAGASEQNRRSLERTLHLPQGFRDADAGFGALISSLKARGEGGAAVRIANRLWPAKGLDCKPEFLEALRRHYRAEPEPLDFAGDTEGSRKRINAWVAKQTQQMIPELLHPGDVVASQKAILTNAIYFRGFWERQFNPKLTKDAPFHAPSKELLVPMMRPNGGLIGRTEVYTLLELPYRTVGGVELAMIVVLPDWGSSVDDVEEAITSAGVDSLEGRRFEDEIRILIPRMKLREKSYLPGLGAAIAACGADASGLVHEAVVETDERGTKAAAATALYVEESEFHADRPFLFLIRDRRSGLVLFLGRVEDPGTAKT